MTKNDKSPLSNSNTTTRHLEFHKALIENLSEGVALLDKNHQMIFCNRAYCSISGYTEAEISECFGLKHVHSEDHEKATVIFNDIFSSPDTVSVVEYRLRQKNDDWVWLETCATNMLEIPDVHAVVFRTRDVTARKKHELHLNRMRNILLESQRIAHFGSFEYIVATQETVWSDEEFRIYGLDPEEGSPDYEDMLQNNIHPDDADLLNATFREAFEKKDIYELEHKIVRPDGTVRIVQDVAQPYFDNDGNLYKYIGTTHDITERRDLEAQLMQAQKMEAIGQLAGGIAHDFNNILIPIIGYVELAMANLPSDDKLYVYLKRVGEAAARAASLTRQILAFSRKQILETRVLDLNEIITNFKEMTQRLIGEDIELETFLEPDLYSVTVDRGQIEQILLNLVVNAREAMPSGGQLTIETSNVYLDEAYVKKHRGALSTGNYAMLAVSDSGLGMDTATQQRIFEPFFTTKKPGEGTGLGLSMVFGIVKQHRGNIWVYSEPGKGTTFKIYLPQTESKVQIPDTEPIEPNSIYGTEIILVVEDEEMVRKLVCETLEAHGYKVIEAQGAYEAVQIVASSKRDIDLLLTDVVMPKMNGQELYRELDAIQPGIKVLYMSGYTDNVIVHHGILDEGVKFLQKPFTIQRLTQKVREGLS